MTRRRQGRTARTGWGGAGEREHGSHRPDGRPREGEFLRIPIALISARADQPRQAMDRAALDELTASIREQGVLQPIRVRPRGHLYEIIAGQRRWVAARRAGLETVPAVVVDANDDQAYLQALIENIQREDLNPIDRGQALSRLRATLGLQSWDEVGRVAGMTRQHVYNLLSIDRLPAPMREDIRAGRLTAKHGRALLRLRGHADRQHELWERIHDEELSGHDALRIAGEMRSQSGPPGEPWSGAQLRAAVDNVQTLLARARPEEIEALRPNLIELRCRLIEVLDDVPAGHR